MNSKEVRGLFEKTGAFLSGHFLLSSGLHSPNYLQCALVLQHPEYAAKLCSELAARFKDNKVTVVAGPALGGVIVSYEVARALGVRSLFTEREEGKMRFRRGFSVSPQDRVLVVEDVITTGRSLKEVIAVIKETGAQVVGAGSIVDRSQEKLDFGVRCERLMRVDVATFKPEDCPLCRQGLSLVKPGSRKR